MSFIVGANWHCCKPFLLLTKQWHIAYKSSVVLNFFNWIKNWEQKLSSCYVMLNANGHRVAMYFHAHCGIVTYISSINQYEIIKKCRLIFALPVDFSSELFWSEVSSTPSCCWLAELTVAVSCHKCSVVDIAGLGLQVSSAFGDNLAAEVNFWSISCLLLSVWKLIIWNGDILGEPKK